VTVRATTSIDQDMIRALYALGTQGHTSLATPVTVGTGDLSLSILTESRPSSVDDTSHDIAQGTADFSHTSCWNSSVQKQSPVFGPRTIDGRPLP
jgi:hypothetical protein